MARAGPEGAAVLVDANLREAMRFFGAAAPQSEIRAADRITLISSGLDYAAFNAALLDEPIDRSADLICCIKAAGQFYATRRVRWSFWLCDAMLAPPVRAECDRIFSRLGLRPMTYAPGLLCQQLLPCPKALPAIDVRPVADEQTRLAFAHIASITFEIPFATCRAVYGTEQAWQGSLRGFVGYAAGAPVSTTALVEKHGSTGLYSVATLPHHQRRGYAEALMRSALGERNQRLVLQATRAGMALYENMGFRKVTQFSVYVFE